MRWTKILRIVIDADDDERLLGPRLDWQDDVEEAVAGAMAKHRVVPDSDECHVRPGHCNVKWMY